MCNIWASNSKIDETANELTRVGSESGTRPQVMIEFQGSIHSTRIGQTSTGNQISCIFLWCENPLDYRQLLDPENTEVAPHRKLFTKIVLDMINMSGV